MIRDKDTLQLISQTIAQMLAAVATDRRGDVLHGVALLLKDKQQNYTAACIKDAAVRYDSGN